jgi:hypothetical protein
MHLIRKVLYGLIIILILLNACLFSWHNGYAVGYSGAMSDVLLQIETPENYFIKTFDIRTPHKVQQNQEQLND